MRPPVSRDIDMRHRKTAQKCYLNAPGAMQLQRTRTIDVVENASETSSDKRPGSATLRRSYCPLNL
jgi:hypothetical protein